VRQIWENGGRLSWVTGAGPVITVRQYRGRRRIKEGAERYNKGSGVIMVKGGVRETGYVGGM
jgi:hypothetical protein